MKIKIADIISLSAFGLLYYVLARFGMAFFSLEPGNITLLWLPSGIALLMCHRWGCKAFPFIFIASFASNYPGMVSSPGKNPLLHTVINSLADALAGFLAARFMKKFLPNGLRFTHDLLPFSFWVCLVTTNVTSLIMALNLYVGEFIPLDRIIPFIRMLVFADSMGILLLYPIYQSWLNGISITKIEIKWIAIISLGLCFLLTLGFTILPALVFFILPLILVLSFNVRIAGVVIISAISFISIVIATALNLGPFITTNQIDTNFRLIAFVFSGALTVLGIALQNQQLSLTETSSKFWQIAAEHDPLTGLINRRAFLPILKKEHQRAMQTGKIYTLALLDLDHFKSINDKYGHHSGDKVLTAITEIMNENCRSSDSIVRMGGEEFAILFPNCTIDEAFLPLERIRANLANQPIEVSNERIYVTTSIGVASFHNDESELELMTRADKALYAAKSAGRNLIILDKKTNP